MHKRFALLTIAFGLLLTGSGVPGAQASKDTCTPPGGWTDTGRRTPDGKIMYQSPIKATNVFVCGPSEQQLAAINAANKARDPKIHTICEAYAMPGHEADLARIKAQSGLDCSDPKYAQPPTPGPLRNGGSPAGTGGSSTGAGTGDGRRP